jgi:hypothetical protein
MDLVHDKSWLIMVFVEVVCWSWGGGCFDSWIIQCKWKILFGYCSGYAENTLTSVYGLGVYTCL